MTHAEHVEQRNRVLASEMRCPTRSQCHGVYRARKPVVVLVVKVAHVYALPVVREKLT